MLNAAWDTVWEKLTLWFPERHVYLRSGDHAQTFVISRRHQILAAFAALVIVGWAVSATLGLAAMAWSESNRETNLARLTAYYERLNADRQARLQMAVGELGRTGGSIESMAHDIERRHAALAWLLQGASGKAGGGPSLASLKPVNPAALPGASAGERIAAVREDQERLLSQAESLLKSRADRVRTALRLAGLDSQRFSGRASQGQGQGGPLIDGKDPRALGAVLDVDPAFAERIQHVAADMTDLRSLSSATEALPLATARSDRPSSRPPLASSPSPACARAMAMWSRSIMGRVSRPAMRTWPRFRCGSATMWASARGSAPWARPAVRPVRICTMKSGKTAAFGIRRAF